MDKTKLYVKVYNDLLSKIKSGELKPGEKIPTEQELTEFYSVSRITVIHALKELEKLNLIRRVKRAGTFVNGNYIDNKRKLLVAVVLPFHENFHANFLRGAQNFALKNNIFLSFFNYENNLKLERNILQSLLDMQVDGVILYPCYSFQNIDIISKLILKGIKVLFFDRNVEGIDAPCVTTDNFNAQRQIVEYLIKTGHKRIAFFGANDTIVYTVRERFKGYVKALMDNKMEIRNEYLFALNDIHERKIYATPEKQKSILLKQINSCIIQYINMKEKPDAICFVADTCAITFLDEANKYNIRIPENLSIVGFDNESRTVNLSVPLTTVAQNFESIGLTCVEIMHGLISGLTYNPFIHIPGEIIIRESTRPRNGK